MEESLNQCMHRWVSACTWPYMVDECTLPYMEITYSWEECFCFYRKEELHPWSPRSKRNRKLWMYLLQQQQLVYNNKVGIW